MANYARIVNVAVPLITEDGETIQLDSRSRLLVKVHCGCSALLEFLGLELSRWWENLGLCSVVYKLIVSVGI